MAKAPDWYRKTTWSESDEADFNEHLRRSRQLFHRCQYLTIQAHTLYETGDPSTLPVVLDLANRAVSEYPHRAFLAGAHLVKANALVDLGRHPEAIQSYRKAVEAQRAYPGSRHLVHLDFGDLVVGLRDAELYQEAESLLADFGDDDRMFPANEFRHHRLRAIFAAARGDRDEAGLHARAALDATMKTETRFRYHRRLGLFQGAPADALDELRALAAV